MPKDLLKIAFEKAAADHAAKVAQDTKKKLTAAQHRAAAAKKLRMLEYGRKMNRRSR